MRAGAPFGRAARRLHRRRRPAAVARSALFGLLWLAGGEALDPRHAAGQPTDAALEDVRVMSFNIRYGTADDGDDAWPNRDDLVADVIEAFRPGILGLQEALAFQLDELAGALPGFEVVGVGRDDGLRAGEFAAILVDRDRYEVVERGTFWFSDTPDVPGSTSWGNRIPRICTWGRLLDRTSGRRFYVYNVHWDHESQASRELSAESLATAISGRDHLDEPVIVTGDLNAGEANPAFRTLVDSPETGLRDTFRAMHPDATDVGTFNGFEGRRDGDKIDVVLASDGWCIDEAAIVRTSRENRHPSDHFPVTAVLRTPRADGCAPHPPVGEARNRTGRST